ncbi:hypothetical protein I5E68_18325 [Novosphingobium sp. YJ-S2-02]|uniref:Nucleotidyltransferase domain-containing protein n=1 Tax=Novosphingobium aureum TaxID=2792964 RepID=A0A931MM95_9SPHN|nr:hypothetical protein [Novosphingobium aureum]MBH0114907.1 hypothetical protein [Novosphingobium aureum]
MPIPQHSTSVAHPCANTTSLHCDVGRYLAIFLRGSEVWSMQPSLDSDFDIIVFGMSPFAKLSDARRLPHQHRKCSCAANDIREGTLPVNDKISAD